MRYLITLALLLWSVSASAFTINGKTYSTWNGKTLASWNGVTAAVAGTPLVVGGFSFVSDNNGGGDGASDATGVIESVTGHTGSAVSAWRINMGFYNNDMDAPDYTPGRINQTVTIPSGGKRISYWIKGSSLTYTAPSINGVRVTPGDSGYSTTGTGWEQVTTDVVSAGTYTLDILVYYPSYAPIYIADISLVAP